MKEFNCQTCYFFNDAGYNSVFCRKYPPKVFAFNDYTLTEFPKIINPQWEWCGEHRDKIPEIPHMDYPWMKEEK